MKRAVMVTIDVDDINKDCCGENCIYLDEFFENCKLFKVDLDLVGSKLKRYKMCLVDLNCA
jgi:hypothetical protein